MNVMNPPEVSVVEPQLAPTRISVVLVEEAKVGGAHRMECPRVDRDLRLLAGMVKPARVTVCRDSHLSTSVEWTLSPPDLAGKLFPVVPAGIPLPVGPVGPVGSCVTISPSNLTSIGLVGSITDPVGPVGPFVARGLVGSYGMLSPFDSVHQVVDGPVGPYVTHGPVGSYGMLSPCDSDQLVADTLHVALWARMGCYPRVTPILNLISLWLMARWAHMLHMARWARMGCYPHVTLISSSLMARWACMLHAARWACMGCYIPMRL